MADDGKAPPSMDQAIQALNKLDPNAAATFEQLALIEKQGSKGANYGDFGVLDKNREQVIGELKDQLNSQIHDAAGNKDKGAQDALASLGGEKGAAATLQSAIDKAPAPTLAATNENSTSPGDRMRAALGKVSPDAVSSFDALVMAESENNPNSKVVQDLKGRVAVEVNAAMLHSGNDKTVQDGVKGVIGSDGLRAEQQAVGEVSRGQLQQAGGEFMKLLQRVASTVQDTIDADPSLHQAPAAAGAKPQAPAGPQK